MRARRQLIIVCATLTMCIAVSLILQNHEKALETAPINDRVALREESLVTTETRKEIPLMPSPKVTEVSCADLFEGAKSAEKMATSLQARKQFEDKTLSAESLLKLASNCTQFKETRHYTQRPLSTEEADFPIAFSLLLFTDIGMGERLLRAVYHPQNVYCIHVDKKSAKIMHDIVGTIAFCFSNIIVVPSIDVHWGTYSVVHPELICMEALLGFHTKWKYFINLTGQEFPLKTNLDMVRILKVYNGQNDIEGKPMSVQPQNIQDRVKYKSPVSGIETDDNNRELKKPFPYNITFFKGAAHIIASRAFVNFTIYNPISRALNVWLMDTKHASETLFNTLNNQPLTPSGTPGMYLGHLKGKGYSSGAIRYKVWRGNPYSKCRGGFTRDVCIMSLGDLPALYTSPKFIVNKFHSLSDPLAYSCLEELHFNRTRDEVLFGRSSHLNLTYYENFNFVLDGKSRAK